MVLSRAAGVVAVVGAGMAGLVASHRLRQLGLEVVLLEAADRPGGMARTVRRDGWTIDTGAVTMARPEGALAELLDTTGASAAFTAESAASARRYLVHEGRPVAVPTTPAEMVATPLLSVAGRLRMLKEPFVARGGGDEETVAAFARRRFGEEIAARFIDPLVSGTSGGDPERLLAGYTFPLLVEFERRSGSVLKGRMRAGREARRLGQRAVPGAMGGMSGLGDVAERLGAALGPALRLGRAVQAVQQRGNRLEVVLADEALEADGVVVAVPATALAALRLALPGDPSVAPVATIPHASVATVSLGMRREQVLHPLDGHGLLAPSEEGRRVLTIQFTSTLVPARVPAGHVLLTATVGGVQHPDDVALRDADLVALVRRECEQLLGSSGEPVLVEIARWPDAIPLAVAGHGARLAAAETAEAASGRLVFCGAWRDGLAIGDVMGGGLAAADRLAARLGWRRPDPEEAQ